MRFIRTNAKLLATLDVIERQDPIRKVALNGTAWKAELEKLVTQFPKQVHAPSARGYLPVSACILAQQ